METQRPLGESFSAFGTLTNILSFGSLYPNQKKQTKNIRYFFHKIERANEQQNLSDLQAGHFPRLHAPI